MPQSNAETADRLNRRHARMMPVLAVFVLIQQAVFFTSGNGQRTVDMVRNGAWVVLVSVIVESFERIHRSNLVGMGVLPLQFSGIDTRASLKLTGDDTFTIRGLADLKPGQDVEVEVTRPNGESFAFIAKCRIDTANEMEYYRNGGILQYVLRKLAA